jgi:hypothetical protein
MDHNERPASSAGQDTTETREATLLSGATITQRPLTLRDQNKLTLATRRRTPRAISDALTGLLDATTVAVGDPGIYTLDAHGRFPWRDALSGDRMDALLHLRRASYPDGDKALCEVRCGTCGDTFGWEVDIEADLLRRPYPPATLAALREGRSLTATVGAHTVTFELVTGASEVRYQRMIGDHPEREVSVLLRSRIVDVTGPDGPINRGEILDWLDGGATGARWPGLSAADAEVLQDAMDAADGGYDTEVEAYHPACGGATRFDLPFSALLTPARQVRERKLARRRGR